jgi:hypothetical protein
LGDKWFEFFLDVFGDESIIEISQGKRKVSAHNYLIPVNIIVILKTVGKGSNLRWEEGYCILKEKVLYNIRWRKIYLYSSGSYTKFLFILYSYTKSVLSDIF